MAAGDRAAARGIRAGDGPAHDGPSCDAALAAAFGLLGKRWNGLILGVLAGGALGFADLRRAIGAVTDSMLSDRLTELGGAGLVQRSVTDSKPPGVRYTLTPAGAALAPILSELTDWSRRHLGTSCDDAPQA